MTGKSLLRKSLRKRIAENWQLYLLIIPAIVYIFIFNYMPMYGIQIAFRDFSPRMGFSGSPFVGLKHFIRFFSLPDFWRLLKNTLTLSLYTLLVGFPLPIILALMLNQCQFGRFKRVIQNVIYAPHFISLVVLVGMMNVMFSPNNGVINTVIKFFGGDPQLFMGDADAFPHMYVWSGIWQNMGWSSIIYFAALSGVSADMHDAAIVDGANKLQRIWYVDLPTIVPTITIMLVLQVGQLMSVGFDKVFLMQNNLNLQTAETISTYIYKKGLLDVDYSYSTAVSLFNNVVNFLLLISVNRASRKMTGSSLW